MRPKHTKRQIQEAISYWEGILLESKVTDLIEKNKWNKKAALKPENFKQLKRAWKKGDAYMKAVLDRVFDKSGKFLGADKAVEEIKKYDKEVKEGKAAAPKEDAGAKEEHSDGKSTSPMKADAKDEAAAKELIDTKETVETAVGDFNINTRLHRIHNGAVKQVREKLGQFLLKQKAGSPETVLVTNSCDKDGRFEMPDDGKMYITVAVKLDKAQLTGFGKMVALMKEADDSQLNEGFWGDLASGFKNAASALGKAAKDTAAAMGKTAKEKLEAAHEKLKKNIGVEALRTYVTAFCGKKLGDAVSLKNIAMNEDEEGTEGAEITFKCLINIK